VRSKIGNAEHLVRSYSLAQLYTFMYVYLLLPCIFLRTLESI
jgi:hypothetical protein